MTGSVAFELAPFCLSQLDDNTEIGDVANLRQTQSGFPYSVGPNDKNAATHGSLVKSFRVLRSVSDLNCPPLIVSKFNKLTSSASSNSSTQASLSALKSNTGGSSKSNVSGSEPLGAGDSAVPGSYNSKLPYVVFLFSRYIKKCLLRRN